MFVCAYASVVFGNDSFGLSEPAVRQWCVGAPCPALCLLGHRLPPHCTQHHRGCIKSAKAYSGLVINSLGLPFGASSPLCFYK